MLRSMTGFARVQCEEPPYAISVSTKSLNHRFLDLHVRVGAEFESLEPRIRATVRKHVRRGHVEVHVQIDSREKPTLVVNREFVGEIISLYKDLRKEHALTSEPDLMAILRMPDVLRVTRQEQPEAEGVGLATLVEGAVQQALSELDRMRRAEGMVLEEELRARAETVRALVGQAEQLSESVRAAGVTQLRQRLQDLLGQIPLDESRLIQEAAYLAERSDISEEIGRLRSHLEQFVGLLAADGAVGKQLDFLLQEMNRETNTLLSKSPAAVAGGLELTRVGLALKVEIERLREQVQNVE